MFEGWDNFYLLVGGGAGALIGTMFVVATLTAGLSASRASRGGQVFITPVVYHFGVVLVVSVLTAIPHLSRDMLGWLLALGSATGVGYAVTTAMRLLTLEKNVYESDLSDKFFYGLAPIVMYTALGVAAWAVWFWPEDAPYILGWVMLLLLAMGVRNAWDLATSLVQRQREENAK